MWLDCPTLGSCPPHWQAGAAERILHPGAGAQGIPRAGGLPHTPPRVGTDAVLSGVPGDERAICLGIICIIGSDAGNLPIVTEDQKFGGAGSMGEARGYSMGVALALP